MNHKNTEFSLALYQPDILVRMPFDSYGEITDYAKAQEISNFQIGKRIFGKNKGKKQIETAEERDI